MQNNTFFNNIIDDLDEEFLNELSYQLKEEAETQYGNRQAWFKTISSSIEALGMSPIQNNHNITEPSSKLVDSAFSQTLLTLVTTFIGELFPPKNIVSTDVKNRSFYENLKTDPQFLQQMDAVCDMANEDMNQKLSIEWDDWRPVLEKGMRSCFLTGGAVFKIYIDTILERPVLKLIPPTNILIPPETDSLQSAQVIFHIFTLTEEQLNSYIENEIFTDQFYSPDDGEVITEIEEVNNANEKNSGTKKSQGDDTKFAKRFTFCEAQLTFSGEKSGDQFFRFTQNPENYYKSVPYNVTFHWESSKIANVRRAWDPNKAKITKIINMVKFTYFEGNDFWGDGLSKLALNLHFAATQVFQDLTKSLTLANQTTLIIGDMFNVKNSNIELKLGKINTLPISGEKISDGFSKIPFDQPSPMFKEFLGDLRNQITSIAGISTLKFDNIPANIQSSVLLAVLDNQTKPMSAVLQHFQIGFNQILTILQRLMTNEMGGDEFAFQGSGMNNEEVYGSPIRLQSAIDPSLANSASQMIRAQSMYEMGTANPSLVKMNHILQEVFKIMKIDNPDNFVFTDEEIQKQQEAQQAQVQQAQQAQAQQAQAQAQQAQAQQELLQKDLVIKENTNLQKFEIDKMKLQSEEELTQEKLMNEQILAEKKLQHELLKEKGDLTKQYNIEETQLYKAKADHLLEKIKLEYELGVEIPNIPEPQLKNYLLDDEGSE